ncbi:MAG: hypothetical protein ACK51V_00810, partial [bacterium]
DAGMIDDPIWREPFPSSVDGEPLVVAGIRNSPMTVLAIEEAHRLVGALERGDGQFVTGRGKRRVGVTLDGGSTVLAINEAAVSLTRADVNELVLAIQEAACAALALPEVVSERGAAPMPLDRKTMHPRELEIVEAFGLDAQS